jgi:hypothetical protein
MTFTPFAANSRDFTLIIVEADILMMFRRSARAGMVFPQDCATKLIPPPASAKPPPARPPNQPG